MPSVLHQLLVELFGEAPRELLGSVTKDLGLPEISTLQFTRGAASFSRQIELDADLVLLVQCPRNGPQCVLIVEIQLSIDRDKARSWPAYQAEAHHRYRCPAFLVVVALDPKVATWASGPFCTGQTALRPIVIGPGDVPLITQFDARTSVEMTLLSGLTHRGDPEARTIGQVLRRLLTEREPPRAGVYWDVFLRTIDQTTRNELMLGFDWYTPQSEWAKRLYAEGNLNGERHALQCLLNARRLDLTEEQRARLDACSSSSQLRLWIRRAATAEALDQVFSA